MPDPLALRTIAEDPLAMARVLWPDVRFYGKQEEILRSVWRDDETVVPAGNMLGKDYVAGYCAIAYFLGGVLLGKTTRVITTSVKDDHLRVLWGEIGRFVSSCAAPLDAKNGGPLVINHRDYRMAREAPGHYSYLRGMVSEKGEGMTGHHAERTLLIIDEASGVDEQVYDQGRTWSAKRLIIGNPNPCTNFFYRSVKGGHGQVGGDIKAERNGHYHRRVIRIRAEDSPNVRYGVLREKAEARGVTLSEKRLLPGVLTYDEYLSRRKLWDRIRQTIGLDAEFYEGAESMLFPLEWRLLAIAEATKLGNARPRTGCSLGVDSAQGGDNTAWAVSDRLGLRYLEGVKTPDTSVIVGKTLSVMRDWNVSPENVLFDRGGGGKEHADLMRARGYAVRTVAFGEASTADPRHGLTPLGQRKLQHETQTAYVNRRAEMYGIFSRRMDPEYCAIEGRPVFAMPQAIVERLRLDGGPSLMSQLAVIQRLYDDRGRLRLPPKNKRPNSTSKEQSLSELIGCSPDEADAVVLSVFGQEFKAFKATVRSMV